MRQLLTLLPGLLGWLIVTLAAETVTLWSANRMFEEGWWGDMPHRFLYLVPALVTLVLASVPLRWPREGGWFLGSVGVALVVGLRQFADLQTGLQAVGLFILVAFLFIFEGRRLDKLEQGRLESRPLPGWWPSHRIFSRPRLLVTLCVPLLTLAFFALTRSEI